MAFFILIMALINIYYNINITHSVGRCTQVKVLGRIQLALGPSTTRQNKVSNCSGGINNQILQTKFIIVRFSIMCNVGQLNSNERFDTTGIHNYCSVTVKGLLRSEKSTSL